MEFKLWNPASQSQIVTPSTGIKTVYFFNWMNILFDLLKATLGQGFTGTIPLAKLTVGGANGSTTYVNGVVISVVPPT